MADEDGNIVVVDADSQIIARAHPGPDGETVLLDADGEPLNNPAINIEFDENGDYIFQPEVVDAVDVSRDNLGIIAEGMRLVNTRLDEERAYTGAGYVDWLEPFGIITAGKTGTSEYCDNIAIERGWCSFDDILLRRILPTHSWYVGYAPFEDPEIVVAAFIYNGGEGSAWSAPIACNVMAAYFGLGQYAPLSDTAEVEDAAAAQLPPVCRSDTFNPDMGAFLASLQVTPAESVEPEE
jgi:penicillin-binding protein 2